MEDIKIEPLSLKLSEDIVKYISIRKELYEYFYSIFKMKPEDFLGIPNDSN